MKKQKINKKRIFIALGLGVTLGSLFIIPMNTANACAIEQPSGVSFSKSYGDLRVIHNRLVDEDIIGYSYNSLYTYYDYDGGWKLDENSGLPWFATYTDKFHSDLVAFVSLDGTNNDLKKNAISQLGNYTSTTYSELKTYTSFNSPVNTLDGNRNFNINNEILVCDLAKLPQITGGVFDKSDSASKDAAIDVLGSIYIVEYVFRSYGAGYDFELTLQNDNDMINEGISFASTNSLMKQIDSTNYSLINDSKYTFWQIKNMFNAYDGAGNTTDVYRDYEAEEELRTNGNAIYNERNIQLGISYMCICGYDYKENKSSITIKINTIKNNITEVLANTKSIVYTNKMNINKTDILNCISKADGNVNEILAYSYTKSDPQQYVDETCRFNVHESWFFVYSNFNGDVKSVEVKYSEKYIEPIIDTSIDNSDDKGNDSGNSGGSNDTTKKDDGHWYDGILKVLINIINWLCGK